MFHGSFVRMATVFATVAAMVGLGTSPAHAAAIPGTGFCRDSRSASGTQRASICVYFEWGTYFPNGVPNSYHAKATIAGYRGIGSSKLQIRRVGIQKCYYVSGANCRWSDYSTTNPSYPKVGYRGWVAYQTANYNRTNRYEGACPQYRAVTSWRIDYSSGGYKTGFWYGPGWFGSCY